MCDWDFVSCFTFNSFLNIEGLYSPLLQDNGSQRETSFSGGMIFPKGPVTLSIPMASQGMTPGFQLVDISVSESSPTQITMSPIQWLQDDAQLWDAPYAKA